MVGVEFQGGSLMSLISGESYIDGEFLDRMLVCWPSVSQLKTAASFVSDLLARHWAWYWGFVRFSGYLYLCPGLRTEGGIRLLESGDAIRSRIVANLLSSNFILWSSGLSEISRQFASNLREYFERRWRGENGFDRFAELKRREKDPLRFWKETWAGTGYGDHSRDNSLWTVNIDQFCNFGVLSKPLQKIT